MKNELQSFEDKELNGYLPSAQKLNSFNEAEKIIIDTAKLRDNAGKRLNTDMKNRSGIVKLNAG